jgi:hypothetical protein
MHLRSFLLPAGSVTYDIRCNYLSMIAHEIYSRVGWDKYIFLAYFILLVDICIDFM